MKEGMKIGELALRTGISTKTIRYYELVGLLPEAPRTESGYRLYPESDCQRLEFVKKAKALGLSLSDIRDVLALHEANQPPCVHVLALLDQKLAYMDALIQSLHEFREELARLRREASEQLERLPVGSAICGIIERGIHTRGELA